jgi:DNA-binding NarL/FixJ family response regulator
MSVRVLVVDDHAVVRAGLKLLLDSAEGIQIAGVSGPPERR